MQSSGTEVLSYITECDSWKFISKFSVGGALRGRYVRGFVRARHGDIQPHSDSVYGSRGVCHIFSFKIWIVLHVY